MQIKKYLLRTVKFFKKHPVLREILALTRWMYLTLLFVIIPIYNILLSILCYKTVKIYLSNHLTIGILELYRKKTKFPHPIGIVIGFKVEIGYNCIIYQNVTIGAKDTKNYLFAEYPKIGNNVTIYPNSIIIGDVKIGDNAIIGAGSVVINDVLANSIVVGNPAHVIIKNEK